MLWVFAKRLWPTSVIVGGGGGSLLLPKRSSTYLNTNLKRGAQQDGDLVQRILEQQTAIGYVLSSDQKSRHLTPTWQDIEALEVINKTLTPLADFTDAISGEQYVSISTVKPILHLFETMMAVQQDDPDLTRSIKTKILHYLKEKYSDPNTQKLLDIATALDPRFKLDYVSEDNKVSVKARLKNEMISISMVSIFLHNSQNTLLSHRVRNLHWATLFTINIILKLD